VQDVKKNRIKITISETITAESGSTVD